MGQQPRTRSDRERQRLERRFVSALDRSGAIPAGSTVLVGTSGGPDSSALLFLLRMQALSRDLQLVAAYFDHQIQPPAERDAERATAHALAVVAGVPLIEGSAPVADLARQTKRSLEEEARVRRYAFLREEAAARGAGVVAVGHTADDQVETILLHLLRGSGLSGLIGMRAGQAWPFGSGPILVRPLLSFTHAETVQYCRLHGFAPHSDSSNATPAHVRNRLRQELLPLLETFNPRARDALLRLGRAAAMQDAWLRAAPEREIATIDESGGRAVLALGALRTLPAAMVVEVLARAHAKVAGSRRGLSERHLMALARLVESEEGRSIDLPHALVARRQQQALVIEHRTAAVAVLPPLPVRQLAVPGRTVLGPWELAVTVGPPARGVLDGPGFMAVPEARAATDGLFVRSRRPGDRLRPAGMAGSKKVQDLLVDAKIPRAEREQVPIVCLGDEVIWVVGLRRAALGASTPNSERQAVITVRRLDGRRA